MRSADHKSSKRNELSDYPSSSEQSDESRRSDYSQKPPKNEGGTKFKSKKTKSVTSDSEHDRNEVHRASDDQLVDPNASIDQQTLLTMFGGLMSQSTQDLEKALQSVSVNAGRSGYKPEKFKKDDNHDVAKWFSVLEAYAEANSCSDEKFVIRLPSFLNIDCAFYFCNKREEYDRPHKRIISPDEPRKYCWTNMLPKSWRKWLCRRSCRRNGNLVTQFPRIFGIFSSCLTTLASLMKICSVSM